MTLNGLRDRLDEALSDRNIGTEIERLVGLKRRFDEVEAVLLASGWLLEDGMSYWNGGCTVKMSRDGLTWSLRHYTTKSKSMSLVAPMQLSFGVPDDALDVLGSMETIQANMIALIGTGTKPKLGGRGYLAVDLGGVSTSLLDPAFAQKLERWLGAGMAVRKKPPTKLMRAHQHIMDMLENMADNGWVLVNQPDPHQVEMSFEDHVYMVRKGNLQLWITARPASSVYHHISLWLENRGGVVVNKQFDSSRDLQEWLTDVLPRYDA